MRTGTAAPTRSGWSINTPDRGIWVLNVSDNYAREQVQRSGQKLFAGWYLKIGPVPSPRRFGTRAQQKGAGRRLGALYNKQVGRSLDEIKAANAERIKRLTTK